MSVPLPVPLAEMVAVVPSTCVDAWPAYVPVKGTRIGFVPVAAPAVADVASTNAKARTEIRKFFTMTPFKA